MSRRQNPPTDRAPDFQGLYLRTPVMMHSIDPDGYLLAVNDFWLKTLGYKRSEVIGRKLTDFFTGKSKSLAEETVLPHFFELGTVREIPYQMVRKNGEIIDVQISANSIRDENGKLLQSVAAILDVTEKKKVEEEVWQLAHYDRLTDLPNRFLLQELLQHALIRAQREDAKVSILFLDLDHFKWVNDTLGHDNGDKLLRKVANVLQGCVRKGDTVARFGGDEFVVVLYGFASDAELLRSVQRFIDTLRVPVRIKGVEVHATASIGVAIYPMDGKDASTLLRSADTAMYAAKELGRNTYQFFAGELNREVMKQISMEARLRHALKEQEFFLEYQPQLELRSGRVSGFEALIRWLDPERGVVSPKNFIPVAESSGLIYPLGEWVLETACKQAKLWQEQGFPQMRMAVNISGRQFRRHDFIDMVEEKLQHSRLDPSCLEIELTESVVMENLQRGMDRLTDLKIRNISLAIDDFGTGYSSLLYLKHFPFDRIKIAQEFVQDIPTDRETAAIVEAIFAMSRALNLDVIAEGVERREQLDCLAAMQCQQMQGYYLSKPRPPEVLTGYMQSGWPQREACLFNA
jgi:diguanylate cyclase (GGDEF)-like protein/PAS domain S-box-containing protein